MYCCLARLASSNPFSQESSCSNSNILKTNEGIKNMTINENDKAVAAPQKKSYKKREAIWDSKFSFTDQNLCLIIFGNH